MRSAVAGLALLALASAPSAQAAGNCYKGSEFTNLKLGEHCLACPQMLLALASAMLTRFSLGYSSSGSPLGNVVTIVIVHGIALH